MLSVIVPVVEVFVVAEPSRYSVYTTGPCGSVVVVKVNDGRWFVIAGVPESASPVGTAGAVKSVVTETARSTGRRCPRGRSQRACS